MSGFRQAVSSTDELDYAEALDWFGLQFGPSDTPATRWTLEARPDASAAQRRHLDDWLQGPT